jgi:hypothetical protein
MLTPAILILACGSLLSATSQRLSRVIERTRRIAEEMDAVTPSHGKETVMEKEERILLIQLTRAARRSRLLQQVMSALYIALSLFVATSVAIGMVSMVGNLYAGVPVFIGLGGMAMLLYATVLLLFESRLGLSAVNEEMNFIMRLRGKRGARRKVFHRLGH